MLKDVKKIDVSFEFGDEIKEEFLLFDFGWVVVQIVKQVIMQKVCDVEWQCQFDEYKDCEGEIINGIVKCVEYGYVIVDFGCVEGIICCNDGILCENFQLNDCVCVYFYKVSCEIKGL